MKSYITPDHLKSAISAWVTDVAIVTGYHQGNIHGMTANRINYFPFTLPTVLVAFNKHTRTQYIAKEGGVIGVSISNKDQVNLSERFAKLAETDQPRFKDIKLSTWS